MRSDNKAGINKLGTANTQSQLKIMLLGSGELGKEFIIEAQRLGIFTIAVDHYQHAPAMQVAHQYYVLDMQNAEALYALINKEQPDFIVPEVEAIATDVLIKLENEGFNIIPSARATKLTMDRQGIRSLAAEKLGLKTSPYQFANNFNEYINAVEHIGIPCVIKPIMSSSGKGQSILKDPSNIKAAWEYAKSGSRGLGDQVIVERFIPFDYEITLLTVRHKDGTYFCPPIGHIQEQGDYRLSWQPHPLKDKTLLACQHIAKSITDELGGFGVFGVELFIQNDEVYFNELSPRPHDTGMVTMVSQNLSEFALHLRAILGVPIHQIHLRDPSASAALRLNGESYNPVFNGISDALSEPNTELRLFGKPSIQKERRMGVILCSAKTLDEAKEKAQRAAKKVTLIE